MSCFLHQMRIAVGWLNDGLVPNLMLRLMLMLMMMMVVVLVVTIMVMEMVVVLMMAMVPLAGPRWMDVKSYAPVMMRGFALQSVI